MRNLYSYPDSWQNRIHAQTLKKTIKKTMIFRSLPLLICLPFDLLYLTFLMLSGKSFQGLIATSKWPDFFELLSKKYSTGYISSPDQFFRMKIKGLTYVPAGPLYILATIGVVLPRRYLKLWSHVVVVFTQRIIERLYKNNPGFLIVHSDALPFGRSLVLAVERTRVLSICIQHGSFSSKDQILERDGSLSDLNIVRSLEDRDLIRSVAPKSEYIIEPNFFLLKHFKDINNQGPRVLLLGEGYHILDEEFNNQYLSKIKSLYNELMDCNIDVYFRPHPSESKIKASKMFDNLDTVTLEESVSQIDSVIGYSSSLLQECAVLGIPAYYITVDDEGYSMKGRNGAVINRFEDLSAVIRSAKINFSQKLIRDDLFLNKRTTAYQSIYSYINSKLCDN